MSDRPNIRDIQERAFQFAFRIVELHEYLCTKRGAARLIARQLLKSGSSVGGNLEEASGAESKPDFISKVSISLKEARESRYWLRLLTACKNVKSDVIAPLTKEAGEIVAILITIVKNAQASPSRGEPFNIQH